MLNTANRSNGWVICSLKISYQSVQIAWPIARSKHLTVVRFAESKVVSFQQLCHPFAVHYFARSTSLLSFKSHCSTKGLIHSTKKSERSIGKKEAYQTKPKLFEYKFNFNSTWRLAEIVHFPVPNPLRLNVSRVKFIYLTLVCLSYFYPSLQLILLLMLLSVAHTQNNKYQKNFFNTHLTVSLVNRTRDKFTRNTVCKVLLRTTADLLLLVNSTLPCLLRPSKHLAICTTPQVEPIDKRIAISVAMLSTQDWFGLCFSPVFLQLGVFKCKLLLLLLLTRRIQSNTSHSIWCDNRT